MTDETWHLAPWRAPTLQDGDVIMFDEPGRIMRKIDYRSHWFRLVKPKFGFYTLLVRHGGGEERMVITYNPQLIEALQALPSDDRYFLLHTLHNLAWQERDAGSNAASAHYRSAFAEGRLKKRKQPGRDAYKIWIA